MKKAVDWSWFILVIFLTILVRPSVKNVKIYDKTSDPFDWFNSMFLSLKSGNLYVIRYSSKICRPRGYKIQD